MAESVNHPSHYTAHPSGIECIDVVERLPFNLGNAIKYLWRAGLKGDRSEDLKKARWYIARELARHGEEGRCPLVPETAATVAPLIHTFCAHELNARVASIIDTLARVGCGLGVPSIALPRALALLDEELAHG